jgi:hypothetical protein
LLQQGGTGLFEESKRLAAFHTRKALEEILQRVPGAEIINEVPHRHPRAPEHWFSAQDLRVSRNEIGLNGQTLPAMGLVGKSRWAAPCLVDDKGRVQVQGPGREPAGGVAEGEDGVVEVYPEDVPHECTARLHTLP